MRYKAESLEVTMTWVYDQKLYKRVTDVQKKEGAIDEQQANRS